MSNGKVMIICLIIGLIKKMLLNEILPIKILLSSLHKTSQYFTKLYNRFGENVKVELDLSYYAKKGRSKRSNRS